MSNENNSTDLDKDLEALDNDQVESQEATPTKKGRGRKSKDTPPEVSFDSVEKEVEDRARRLAKVRATVDGTEYNFPLNDVSMSASARLGSFFTKDMLRDGQMFSINPYKGAFCVVSECGMHLNADNPKWEYKEGTLAPSQQEALIYVVRAGNILIGDMRFAKIEPKEEKVFVIDAAAILKNSPNEIFVKVSEIIQAVSPGGDREKVAKIKALITYESNNQSRPGIMRLMQDALNNIPGYLGLESTDDAIAKAEEQYDKRAEAGHYEPRSSAEAKGPNYVNAVL